MISTNYNNVFSKDYGKTENNITQNQNKYGLKLKNSSPEKDCVSFGAGDYKKTGNMVEYVKEDSTEEEVINALKDSQNTKRSFFGYKKKIAGVFLGAKDKKTAAVNLNVLLNAKNQTLKAREILSAISAYVDAANYNPADDLAKYMPDKFNNK